MQNPLTNPELEAALLGILMVDPDAYMRVSDSLREHHFSSAAHRVVFQAISATALGGDINYVSVANLLEATGKLEIVGGATYIARLLDSVTSVSYLEQHANKVQALAQRRELVGVAEQIARDAHDLGKSVVDVQASAESLLLDAATHTDSAVAVSASHLAADLLTRVGAFMSGEARWNSVPTGIGLLDDCLAGGLEPGVYIIAGRPSMGKSALMLQIATSIASRGKRVIFFSIEMSNHEVGLRMMSTLARVPLRLFKAGLTTPEQNSAMTGALGEISEWPMHLIDRSDLRAADVLLTAQRIALEHKDLAAVFVDGLWLMMPEQKFGNRVQEIGSISKGVKRAQRHLDIPIVITHQLSRNPEYRNDKRPMLADLRSSGDCEQDADVVLMLYREKYYDPDGSDEAEIWVRKNRLGGESNERIRMFWVQNIGHFERISYDTEQ